MRLVDMQYSHTVEIDLGTLRQIVKMSVALKSDHIMFSVHKPCNASNDAVSCTMFTLSSKGEAEQSHSFYSATVKESCNNESQIIRAATDSTTPPHHDIEMKTVYKDSFSAHYLTLFLKAMERSIITMRLSEEKPLIVHYPLGADKSYVCFVLAPKTSE